MFMLQFLRPLGSLIQCLTVANNPACHADADDGTAGLIPRALKDLFAKTAQLGSPDDRQHCRICMSYVEIYNERLHDLLQPYKPNARLDPQVHALSIQCTPLHRNAPLLHYTA